MLLLGAVTELISFDKMSRFYILEVSVVHKVIGNDFPQCIGLLKGYINELSNPLSLYSFAHRKGERIDYRPDLSAIKVGIKTQLTDLVSCSLGPGNDLLLSTKFKNIIKSFKTSPIQIFPAFLNRKSEIFKYWWIHFIYSLERKVDYENSVFSHSDKKLEEKAKNI